MMEWADIVVILSLTCLLKGTRSSGFRVIQNPTFVAGNKRDICPLVSKSDPTSCRFLTTTTMEKQQ